MENSFKDLIFEFGQQRTVKEVSKLMKCSEDHVRALHREGELCGIDISRAGSKRPELRFSEESLDQFEERRRAQAMPAKPVALRKAKAHAQPASNDSAWYYPNGRGA